VRGAPAIAVVGILSLVAEVYDRSFRSVDEFCELVEKQLDYLVTARPTAVNMADACSKLLQQLRRWTQDESVTADGLKHRCYAVKWTICCMQPAELIVYHVTAVCKSGCLCVVKRFFKSLLLLQFICASHETLHT